MLFCASKSFFHSVTSLFSSHLLFVIILLYLLNSHLLIPYNETIVRNSLLCLKVCFHLHLDLLSFAHYVLFLCLCLPICPPIYHHSYVYIITQLFFSSCVCLGVSVQKSHLL